MDYRLEPEPEYTPKELWMWELYQEYKELRCKCDMEEGCACLSFEEFQEAQEDEIKIYEDEEGAI